MSDYDSMPREFGWDDEIQRDESPFQVLPERQTRKRHSVLRNCG